MVEMMTKMAITPQGSALRLAKFGLMLVCAASAIAMATELGSGLFEVAAAPRPQGNTLDHGIPAAILADSSEAGAAFTKEIEDRPLFTPGRHPPAGAVIAAEAPGGAVSIPAWNWRLSGIIVSADQRAALLMRDTEKMTVAQGELIDGWTVTAVDPDNVTISAGDGRVQTLSPEPGAGQARPAPNPITAFAQRRGHMSAPALAQEFNKTRAAFTASAQKMLGGPGTLGKPIGK